ncbi:MAG: hypothetical protein JOZ62_07565 [Acidobacteriaceae bacterium]|nr:hypothetical protein [Acidobacteriaceae bacterium]
MDTVIESVREPGPRRASDTSSAVIRFAKDWQEFLEGGIRPSGELRIDYDPERLTTCHTNWHGADIWNIRAYVRFHPGGQLFEGSVLKELRNGGLVYAHRPQPLPVTVPDDAVQVEIWFHTWYQLSSFCEAWDSRFGQNYWFEVAR